MSSVCFSGMGAEEWHINLPLNRISLTIIPFRFFFPKVLSIYLFKSVHSELRGGHSHNIQSDRTAVAASCVTLQPVSSPTVVSMLSVPRCVTRIVCCTFFVFRQKKPQCFLTLKYLFVNV